MRKIIWTIAAVFCVQIAFQLAMTADRSNADYATLRTPLQNGIDTSSPALGADALDTTVAPMEPDIARSSVQTRVVIRYVPIRESFRQSAPATTAFKPVVITYDRTGALSSGSDSTATVQRRRTEKPTQPEDKRSLIAKVVSKPYDLLRVFGSKLR